MKKIKLFFLAFLSVCLGLTSFSSAFNINSDGVAYLDSIALNSGSFSNAYLPLLYEIPNPDSNNIRNLCVVFKNFQRSSDFGWGLRYADSVALSNIAPLYQTTSPYSLYCVSGRRSKFFINWNTSSNRVSTEKFWVFDSSYLGDLFELPSQYSSLSGSLGTCIAERDAYHLEVNMCEEELSNCRGGQDASLLACIDQKEQCESSLSTLSGNYASLENMNSSLSSQLQECLENASNSTGELICNKFDLFWSSNNSNYSYPINNDLILPPGYKGFVNEGVLAIKKDSSLESAYNIDDEDFQGIVSDFGKVFVFIFSGGLFVLFLFIIRKYFTSLFR